MEKLFCKLIAAFLLIAGCGKQEPASSPVVANEQKLPFSVSVVPQTSRGEQFGSSIEMAHKKPRDFYVVLANVSNKVQPIWEYWNSWGYQAVSFEITTRDGRKAVASRRQGYFTRNFPSTFLVDPGEHQVYAIHLDEFWETHPSLPKVDEMPITLKAIYEVSPTPEAAQYGVWTGRAESRTYSLTLRQW